MVSLWGLELPRPSLNASLPVISSPRVAVHMGATGNSLSRMLCRYSQSRFGVFSTGLP